jgi:site-specific recombinase XerD
MRNGHDRLDVYDRAAAAPLKGYLRLYETQLRSERKAAKTIQAYFYVLGKFSRWLEAELDRPPRLGDLSLINARSFLVAAQEKTRWDGHPYIESAGKGVIAGATVHQYVRTLKTFGSWVEREEYSESNPLGILKLPQVEQKQLVPLSEDEERLLIGTYDDNNPNDCRTKAIFLLMLDTGLRLAEVAGLREQNVDFEHGFVLVMGKGRKERSVPFGSWDGKTPSRLR